MRDFLKYNRNALLWAFFILVLCSVPMGSVHAFRWFDMLSMDKLAHICLFAVLMLLILLGQAKKPGYTTAALSKIVAVSIVLCTLYGILIELMQGYVLSGRSMDFMDAIANTLGSFAGWGAFALLKRVGKV